MTTKFINAFLLGKGIKQVLVEGDKIKKIADIVEQDADKVVDVEGNILSSGFANCHCHNPMSLLRCVKDDVNLQTWLFDYMIPLENKLSEEDIYYGELLGILENIRSGVTLIEENYFCTKAILKAIKKTKIRARIGLEDKDKNSYALFDEIIDKVKDDPLLKPCVYVHSIYTYSDEEIEDKIIYSKQKNLPLSIHLSETLTEVGDCSVKTGKSPVEYLEDLGFFDRPTTCYHCVHMDKDDAQILANYDVNVVTCPASNLKLASGIAPLNSFLSKNINICIGTDGPASNNNIDMFKEMFLCSTLQKAQLYDSEIFGARQVYEMATKNGYRALGFDGGEVEEGKLADLIVINTNKLHYYPANNSHESLVFCGKSSDVSLTMIGGEIVFENGKFNLDLDENEIVEKCKQIRKRLEK